MRSSLAFVFVVVAMLIVGRVFCERETIDAKHACPKTGGKCTCVDCQCPEGCPGVCR